MATIPTTQKFHTVDTSIDTHDFGSAQLAAGRSIFTMQDILDTVVVGGGVDGSGTAGSVPVWSDTNTIGDSIIGATATVVTIGGSMVLLGATLQMADTSHIVNAANTLTKYGFEAPEIYQVTIAGLPTLTAAIGVTLYEAGAPKLATTNTGVSVTGIAAIAGDVVATGDVGGNTVSCTLNSNAATFSVTAMNTPPASAVATGTEGDIRWTAGHVYLCTATNTWVRAALATF